MARRKETKTNAMRILDTQGIDYVAHSFSSEIHSADGVAAVLGLPPEKVFKTLVVMPPRGRPLLAMVPATGELDLKALAAAAGIKKLHMATQREAEDLTGLLVGGISALALLNRGFRMYLDQSAVELDTILVSGGQRGLNIELAPADVIRVTRAVVCSIARTPAPTS